MSTDKVRVGRGHRREEKPEGGNLKMKTPPELDRIVDVPGHEEECSNCGHLEKFHENGRYECDVEECLCSAFEYDGPIA